MLEIDSFSHAIAQIYDASLSVEAWDPALSTLAGLFDSPKAQISYYNSYRDASAFIRIWGVFDDDNKRNLSKYRKLAATDPRIPPRLFKAYHCRQIVSDEALRSSVIYQQALAPAGIEYSMYFGVELDDGAKCAVGVMRGPKQAAFTAEDCEDLGRFIPHVSRAVSMHGTLRRARGAVEVAQALINGVPLGMMVVHEGKVVLANSAARELLDQGDPLLRSGGRLQATTSHGDAKLEQAIREARNGGDKPVGVTLPAGEAEQVRVIVRRLPPSTVGMLGAREGAVALYLADSRRPVETSEEVLRRLFGLTEREATVLRALIQGDDARGIARRLDIGSETVKSHLRHIMQTIGVSRQAELIALVLSSPAWVCGQSPEAAALTFRGRGPLPTK